MADTSTFAILFETKTTDKGEKLAAAIKALADNPGGLNDFGLVSCLPWWCTTYHNKEESLKYIQDAAKEMRKDIAAVKNSRGC